MAGEMSYIDQNGQDNSGNIWEIHAAIAKAIGGNLKPFDQYQGPYIVVGQDLTAGKSPYCVPVQGLGIIRLWIVAGKGEVLKVYREDTDELSFGFWWDDTNMAIEAAKSLLT